MFGKNLLANHFSPVEQNWRYAELGISHGKLKLPAQSRGIFIGVGSPTWPVRGSPTNHMAIHFR